MGSRETKKNVDRINALGEKIGYAIVPSLGAWGLWWLFSSSPAPWYLPAAFFASLVGCGSAYAFGRYLAAKSNSQYLEERAQQAESARLAQLELNQSVLRDRIKDTHQKADMLMDKIPRRLTAASTNLNHAESLFKQRAFSPFWSAIENAVSALAEFSADLRQFEDLVSLHSSTATSLRSTYNEEPAAFPVKISDLYIAGQAQAISGRVDTIVGKAHQDYQFASIYEQRRTSAIMVEGFSNLGQAISSMTSHLSGQLDGVVRSIDTASSQSSQYSREALTMLDNIQNRRFPLYGTIHREY